MEPVMKAWTDKLASFALPMWLVATLALFAAAALLSVFVDTLQAHVRHADELRLARQHPVAQPPAFLTAANAAMADPAQIKLR